MHNILERLFRLQEKGTSVKTELLAGVTTFIALAYIMFINPNILADAGIPKEAASAATIWIAALSSMAMGICANYPVAMAPSMGLNAFFAYYVVGVLHLSWQTALGAVFFSGLLFLLLTMGGIRQAIINSVPPSLRDAISIGIGLFIAFIGLKGMGLIVADPGTYIALGRVMVPETLLPLFGFFVTIALMVHRVRGAILLGIIATTLLSMMTGYSPLPHDFRDIMSMQLPSMEETFLQLDIVEAWHYGIVSIIFTFTVVELFNNMGTLIGLTSKAGLIQKDGQIENIDKALTVDAVGTILSAVFGTSAASSYLESAAGIAAGGKTGLTAVTVGVLFLVALFFAPLISLVPGMATAPALVIVGGIMMEDIVHIDFSDLTEGLPAFFTIIMMPLTSSIANGFAFGFISYVLIKSAAGKLREVDKIMWGVSLAFLVNLVLRS